MRTPPAPTPAEQVIFLGQIERLVSEGQFVATYKYALLVAIADLAVQFGADDGGELDLPVRAIAEQFIELYWRQCAPYGDSVADGEYSMLIQSTGRQASMISIVGDLRSRFLSLTAAKTSTAWQPAVTKTAKLVDTMPLWRLQVLRSETLEFLYKNSSQCESIRLRPGVMANLRQFHGMIVRLAQSEWLRYIQALPGNASLLGATSVSDNFYSAPSEQPCAECSNHLPTLKRACASIVCAESMRAKWTTSCRGQATPGILRTTLYSPTSSAIARKATYSLQKVISIDGSSETQITNPPSLRRVDVLASSSIYPVSSKSLHGRIPMGPD